MHEETPYVPIGDPQDYDRSLSESPRQQDALFQDDRLPLLQRSDWSIRRHRGLAFFTDVDRDLRCIVDALLYYSTTYYERLKNDAFLNASIYQEIARSNEHDIAHVGRVKMRLAMAVIQHLCARLRNRTLKQQLINGLVVLHHYYYFYVCARAEELIIADLLQNRQGTWSVSELVPGEEENDRDFLHTLSVLNREACRYKILVPWTECLDLVRRREVLLRGGLAYLDYTQVAAWSVQRWISGFRQWTEHDQLITIPLIDKHLDNLSREGGMSNRDFKAERVKVQRSYELILMRDLFYLEPELGADFDARRFLHPIYAQLFAHVRSSGDTEQRTPSKSVLETNYPQFFDYIEVMPPCILSLYKKTLDARTHFKYDDRFLFFTWAYKTGMSLHLLEDMWTRMCEQDTDAVRQGKLASLSVEPSMVYTRHDQSDKQVGLHRCETLQKTRLCAFTSVDIEDLTQQKTCVNSVCGSSTNWHQHLDTWSPMAATRFKVKQKKN